MNTLNIKFHKTKKKVEFNENNSENITQFLLHIVYTWNELYSEDLKIVTMLH